MVGLLIVGGMIAAVIYAISKQMGDGVLSSITFTPDDATDEPTNDGSNDPVEIALPLIQDFEGFSANAYEDPPGSGKFSIGYGHSIRPGESYNASSVIGKDEATDLLRVDIGAAWTCVYQNVKVTCNATQYAALISFTYNEGCAAFKASTLLQRLNASDFDGATAEFSRWDKSKVDGVLTENAALIDRRATESILFSTGSQV